MIQAGLTHDPISLNALIEGHSELFHGAQVVFTGAVRNHNQGKPVRGVSYEAFEPLTEGIFTDICEEAQEKWGPDLSIRLVHRLGRLEVGELSVVIIVASRHRDESYQASRYIIEELKHRAPIWKKEHYETGDSEWLQWQAFLGHSHSEPPSP